MASLVSVEQAKQYLGISSGDQDALLEAMIEQISAEIEERCGRPFTRQSFTERHRATWPTAQVIVRRRPVLAITRIIDETTGAEIDPAGAMVDAEAGLVRLASPLRDVSITYDAGYDQVPADVAGAVLAVLAAVWQDRTRAATELTLGEYRTAIDLAMPQVAAILARYPADVGF